MRKVFSKINIPALLTTVALIMLILAVPDFTYAQGGSSPGFWSRVASAFEAALLAIPGAISIIILKLATLLTHLSGMILNYVVQFTVVEMSAKIEGLPMINLAWRTIRDVANMAFIFVLLYAAITTILGMGEDNKKLIVRVVIVAILINFSLFFTKLVIDASNVIAISFYDAIAPGATAQNLNLGISSNLMGVLNLQSIYDATGGIPGADLLTIGVMGTILALVAAFVFFAISIMLVIRFVVLIFTMILSPIAFMSFILPQLSKYRDQWWNALSGQAFFAPIYFLLTWIVIVISRGILGATGGTNGNLATALGGMVGPSGERIPANEGSIALLVNFIIVIVLLIASLMIAKEWANKAGSGVSSATKWAMGAAGGATLGLAGAASRATIGRAGQALGESEALKKARDWTQKRGGFLAGTVGGGLIRGTQAVGKKAGSSTFDMRGTGLGGTLDAGKASGKGGYEAWRKEAAKKEEEYAKSQEPSDKTKSKAKNTRDEANKEIDTYQKEYEDAVKRGGQHSVMAQYASRNLEKAKKKKAEADEILGNKDEVEGAVKREEDRKKREAEKIKNNEELRAAELAERSAQDTVNKLEAEAKSAIGTADEDRRKMEVAAAKENLEKTREAAKEIRRINKETIEKSNETFDKNISDIKESEVKPIGEVRKKNYADEIEKSRWAKFRGYNYTAAAQIRRGKKSAKELIDEALKATGEKKDEEEKSETPPVTPPPPTTPPPTGGTT